ncbi:hypothetical protein ACVWXO_006313 [Bradyrhizobium sp. LM2.7]
MRPDELSALAAIVLLENMSKNGVIAGRRLCLHVQHSGGDELAIA